MDTVKNGAPTVVIAKNFLRFCESNPELRFMQALYAFLRFKKIEVQKEGGNEMVDCFYLQNNAILAENK